jgi:hypothetical protein
MRVVGDKTNLVVREKGFIETRLLSPALSSATAEAREAKFRRTLMSHMLFTNQV